LTSRDTTDERAGDGPSGVDELVARARELAAVDASSARTLLHRARAAARAGDDLSAEALVIDRIAHVEYELGRLDEAFAVALEALELARRVGNAEVEVSALLLAGRVHGHAGNAAAALRNFDGALQRYREAGLQGDEGRLLREVGEAHRRLGQYDQALVALEAALGVQRGMTVPAGDVAVLVDMARVRAERGEHLLAIGLCEHAAALAQQQAPGELADIEVQLAESYQAIDDSTMVEDHLRAAYTALAFDDRPATSVRIAVAESAWRRARGEFGEAVAVATRAVETASRATLREPLIACHRELLAGYKGMGRIDEALQCAERLLELTERNPHTIHPAPVNLLAIEHEVVAARFRNEIVHIRAVEIDEQVGRRTAAHHGFTVELLQQLVDRGDPVHGRAHADSVGELSAAIARELGEPERWCSMLQLAAQLHDVGKALVDDAISRKPGELSGDEFELMKQHARHGADLLSGSPSEAIALAAEVARSHHERWDGQGYPDHLERVHIPLAARIVAVADVFDALRTPRPDRPQIDTAEALALVRAGAGSQFEPRVVDALERVIAIQSSG
jgi:HD-GYP domain-containing protein (c-di-GMP phosphodiesterase class II)